MVRRPSPAPIARQDVEVEQSGGADGVEGPARCGDVEGHEGRGEGEGGEGRHGHGAREGARGRGADGDAVREETHHVPELLAHREGRRGGGVRVDARAEVREGGPFCRRGGGGLVSGMACWEEGCW